MSCEAALQKAWKDLKKKANAGKRSLKLLNDKYEVNLDNETVFNVSQDSKAKDFVAVLILRYLVKKDTSIGGLTGEWISFRDLEGGSTYYPAFRRGAIEPILKKYGSDISRFLVSAKRAGGSIIDSGDAGAEFNLFEGVPVRLVMWEGSSEFQPEATYLFDKSIKSIFSTEEITAVCCLIAYNV